MPVSVSSLLKSAESRRQKIKDTEAAYVDFYWQNGAQNYSDFVDYTNYVKKNAGGTPSDKLSAQKKLVSARRSFTSNEIQRRQIGILEARGSLTDKKNSLVDLYYAAVDNNDFNLAQNLRQQIDTADIAIQRENDAAQRAYETMAKTNTTSIQDATDQIRSDIKWLGNKFKSEGNESFKKQFSDYAKSIGVTSNGSAQDILFQSIGRLMQDIDQTYKDGIAASASSPEEANKLIRDRASFLSTETIALPGANGQNINLTYKDVQDELDARRFGESMFRIADTGKGTVFERNQTANYVWGRDADGKYKLIANYEPQSKDFGRSGIIKDGQEKSWADLFREQGFNVIGDSASGYLEIQGTNATSQFGIPGITGNESFYVYLDNNGKPQIVTSEGQAYQAEFDDTGKLLGINEQGPSPITQYGSKYNDPYYLKFLQDGGEIEQGLVGHLDKQLADSRLSQLPFDGNPAELTNISGNTPADILQGAAGIRQAEAEKKLQLQAAAKASEKLQATAKSASRLQGTADPFKVSSKGPLKVTRATPSPRLKVTTAKTNQKDVKVGTSSGSKYKVKKVTGSSVTLGL